MKRLHMLASVLWAWQLVALGWLIHRGALACKAYLRAAARYNAWACAQVQKSQDAFERM